MLTAGIIMGEVTAPVIVVCAIFFVFAAILLAYILSDIKEW